MIHVSIVLIMVLRRQGTRARRQRLRGPKRRRRQPRRTDLMLQDGGFLPFLPLIALVGSALGLTAAK